MTATLKTCSIAVAKFLDTHERVKSAIGMMSFTMEQFKNLINQKLTSEGVPNELLLVPWSFTQLDWDISGDLDMAEFHMLIKFVHIECEAMIVKALGGKKLVEDAIERLDQRDTILAHKIKILFQKSEWEHFCQQAFKECDVDGDNKICESECGKVFWTVLHKIKSERELTALPQNLDAFSDSLEHKIIMPAWKTLDADGSKFLEQHEFSFLLQLIFIHVLTYCSDHKISTGEMYVATKLKAVRSSTLYTEMRLKFLSQEFDREVKEWFRRFDQNRDAVLQRDELRKALQEYHDACLTRLGAGADFSFLFDQIFSNDVNNLDHVDGGLALEGFTQAIKLCEIAVIAYKQDATMDASSQEPSAADRAIANLLVQLGSTHYARALHHWHHVNSPKFHAEIERIFYLVDKQGIQNGMIDDNEMIQALIELIRTEYKGIADYGWLANFLNNPAARYDLLLQLHDLVGCSGCLEKVQFAQALKWLYIRLGFE